MKSDFPAQLHDVGVCGDAQGEMSQGGRGKLVVQFGASPKRWNTGWGKIFRYIFGWLCVLPSNRITKRRETCLPMRSNSPNVVFYLLILLFCAIQCLSQDVGCGASPQALEILAKIQIPSDPRQPASERNAFKLHELRQALNATPKDIFLHGAYQDIQIGEIGGGRESAVKEYEALLAKNPKDPALLYLAARAEYSRDTKQAISNLDEAIKLSPEFGLPHLLLGRIYSTQAFSDRSKLAQQLDRYSELCPASVLSFPELRWSHDFGTIRKASTRIRAALKFRNDVEAEAAYSQLWLLEAAPERSDEQAVNRHRIFDDVKLLQNKKFPRTSVWLDTLQTASDLTDRPEFEEHGREELAKLFPESSAALNLAWSEYLKVNPFPADRSAPAEIQANRKRRWETALALARRWRGALSISFSALSAATHDSSSALPQIREALDLFEFALKQNAEDQATSPPESIMAAAELVERGIYLEDVPSLVRQGLEFTDMKFPAPSGDDIHSGSPHAKTIMRDIWEALANLSLAEAYIRLSDLSNAKTTLLQLEDKLNETLPSADASSEEKSRHAEWEAQRWYLMGWYAETENRALDALIDYRNAIVTFPPRRPNPDRRDEVMQKAQAVWKRLGGTAEGWNDWAAKNSLGDFYAGAGQGNAWAHLESVHPTLEFVDSLGHPWKPQDLSNKVTFVILWASWCGPCRAELPYAEKLYERFKGREDVAVLALNVDDDPAAMEKALKELRVHLPSVAARNFAYDLVPAMALPANWIIARAQTTIFNVIGSGLDGWLEDATKACEKALVP